MKKTPLALVSCAALSLLLGGCAQVQQALAPAPAARESQEIDDTALYVRNGSAADNEPYFVRITKEYAESDQPLTGEAMVNTFSDAGFIKSDMQVSYDKTKINLDADSLFLSVRFGDECLIAQVGRAARDYVTDRAPVVGADPGQCLIGQTRPIDW
ncbi:DUF6993 domain-containing protein [Canibacter oris]|uniref:DUF6993 domain-containing protein n=1 Tax=Canibacter oris TaxID=1365628 RepID=A0A840DKA6_9MICO|nr:hypothetical protein [Canibacter oris]MBB4071912.1 hypothetical protein [Canibacter oris]